MVLPDEEGLTVVKDLVNDPGFELGVYTSNAYGSQVVRSHRIYFE